MHTRKVQTHSEHMGNTYYRLYLPAKIIRPYVKTYGEKRHIRIIEQDMLQIGNFGQPIHLRRYLTWKGLVYTERWRITIPRNMSSGIKAGDEVDITQDGANILLKFPRRLYEMWQVDEVEPFEGAFPNEMLAGSE